MARIGEIDTGAGSRTPGESLTIAQQLQADKKSRELSEASVTIEEYLRHEQNRGQQQKRKWNDLEWYSALHRGFSFNCCALHKNYYNYSDMLGSEIIVGYNMVTMKLEVHDMLVIPELAMPKSQKVTTVCNGRREIWTDYEQAKAYFLELMMSMDGEEHERAKCVYIQLLRGLEECSNDDV